MQKIPYTKKGIDTMAEYATSLEGDTREAFRIAAEQIAEEQGTDVETVMKSMKKLIYLFVTRI